MSLRRQIAALFCVCPGLAFAQLGVTSQGNTGGLVIPSAQVLPQGSVAASVGSYSEPDLGSFSKRRNHSFGVGLLPNVELFGRFAEYQNPLPGSTFVNGPRDISANAKLKLPPLWKGQPNVAIGVNDISGGASLFKSRYAVVSDHLGPVRWSAGYAWGSPILGDRARGYAFTGVFGGVEWSLGQSGVSLLGEYDGRQSHVGARYTSPAVPWLAGAHIVATLQRSLGAQDRLGADADRTSAALSVVVPFEAMARKPETFKPSQTLASLDAKPAGGMTPTDADKLESLQRALVAAGFERVRVGVRGSYLLVEYENHRYGQNEADAIGLALGLAAELAPAAARRISAVTLKAGLRVYEVSVDIAIYRMFLRDGDASHARSSLAVDRAPNYAEQEIRWHDARPSRRTPLRMEIRPDLVNTVATEFGVFDYSLAVDIQAIVPLWQGAELYTSYIQRVSNTDFYEPGFVFGAFRQRNGLKVVSLQQGHWLGEHVYANVGVGRYNYDAWGVQAEATAFVPGRDDVVRLRGGAYQRQPGQSRRQAVPLSASYRWVPTPTASVEAGYQQYSDGSWGPSVVLTRWFGDVGVHLFYRKGGIGQFAGLELSIPLTPRQGMEPRWVQVSGSQRFQHGVRTRLVDSNTSINFVTPNAARDFQLDYNAEIRHLNSGRMSERYFIDQLFRMREAFYLYARQQLPH